MVLNPFRWLQLRAQRCRARRRINREISLWYHSEYVAPCLEKSGRALDIQLDRGGLITGGLIYDGLLKREDLMQPPLAEFDDLRGTHTEAYLDATTRIETLAEIFGMEPGDVRTEELLRAQRRAVGGTIAAARAVVGPPVASTSGAGTSGTGTSGTAHPKLPPAGSPPSIAFNLGGGFHHAEPARGAGFCVYNDVAVAVNVLRRDGYSGRIAIIDLDYHEGNGNVMALGGREDVRLFSVHGAAWTHEHPTNYTALELPFGAEDDAYLAELHKTLPVFLEDFKPALVFYIAGNDVLALDRLGDFSLTPKGVFERDRLLVDEVRKADARLVITLAGGYSTQAWECSANLIRYLLADNTEIRSDIEPELRARYRAIASTLNPFEFQDGDSDADWLGMFGAGTPGETGQGRVLGFYSAQGVELALDRFGILKKIRQRGFEDLRVSVSADDPDHQIVRIHGRPGVQAGPGAQAGLAAQTSQAPSSPAKTQPSIDASAPAKEQILVEAVIRRVNLTAPEEIHEKGPLRLISIEWLMLQDPVATFSTSRPQLPGQQFPGLGIGRDVQELLVQVCRYLKLDGLYSRPSHFHTAWGSSKAFRFLNPVDEGQLFGLHRLLAEKTVAAASRIVTQGALWRPDGTRFEWNPGGQILPVSPRLVAHFKSKGYRDGAAKACAALLREGLKTVRAEVGQDVKPG